MEALSFLGYGFAQRALLAGVLIGTAAALLGVFLVLRRFALLGDGLSHVSFAGVALGLLAGVSPVWVAMVVAAAGSFGIMRLAGSKGVYGDTAIGIVSAAGVAAGVVISSLAGGFNTDLLSYLFGSILAVSEGEVWACAVLCGAVAVFVLRYKRRLLCIAFDEECARANGINVKAFDAAFAALAAVTVVLAVRVAGIMLVSALLIVPASAALRVARGFNSALLWACAVAAVSVLAGLLAAFTLNIPPGGAIVLASLALFGAAAMAGKLGRKA